MKITRAMKKLTFSIYLYFKILIEMKERKLFSLNKIHSIFLPNLEKQKSMKTKICDFEISPASKKAKNVYTLWLI